MTSPSTGSSGDANSAGFADLGIDPRIVATLTALGYEEPTPIQRQTIPVLLRGRDLIGQAATGTGKTAAFAIPLLQRIDLTAGKRPNTQALVLVPTRELAMQVAQAVHRYGKEMGVSVLPIYGGQSIEQQLRVLRRGVDVIIATPGRALDHIKRRTLSLAHVRVVVLDEADEMLDMGFAEDLEAILDSTPSERQTALFSATIPARIAAIAQKYLTNPVRIAVETERIVEGTAPRVRQTAYIVARAHKLAALGRVLDMEAPTAALVFCRTRTEVDELTESLNGRGYRAEALHGGMSQEQRDRVMRRFRDNAAELLIATDVAARGLDIEHLSHVVNYDVPAAADGYVHRIGRTGRAGREGVAITLAEPREHRLLRNIERLTKQRIEVSTVPTASDLRARRLELTQATLRETLLAGGLDTFRVAVEALSSEFDIMDVAAAAIKLAHGASGGDDHADIPSASAPRERPERTSTERKPGDGSRGPKSESRDKRPRRKTEWSVARLYVGAGRKAGVRPADLVGAITNEVGVDSWAIGSIEIADRFSVVEVPEEIVDDIIEILRSTTIKGKRVLVRRDREG
ncbi:MAG: DEAD/DEAH box helicase [Gemmatimonadaceae bacterium]